jgi:transcriptional regulator with XRE-family HTH domain
MDEAILAEYAWWNLTEAPLPERSTLYAPTPIGVGTPFGESLTSYLVRLAEAHCVYPGVLLSQMMVPLMAEREEHPTAFAGHPLWRRDGSGSHLINATGPRAGSALAALETLTLRIDLCALTLVKLAELLPPRGLLRRTLAWCPVCYEECEASGQSLYDPLLWVFQEISVCTRHRVRLHIHCPHCARLLPHLTWRSRPGYCAFCAGALFGEQEDAMVLVADSPSFAWQQWVTHSLGAVVARLPATPVPPKRERIRQVVSHAVERLADGSIAAFARALGLPRGTVEHWCQGKRIPEMDMLLRLCYRLDLSVCEVLFSEGEMPQPSLREPVPEALFPSRKRSAIDRERIFHLLEQAARGTETPPLSLKEVGKLLGYQPTTLYKINQTACHAIAECYTAHRREMREKRLQGYREEIRQIALYLQAEQVPLTQRHIGRYLAKPAILRDPKVREILHEVCHEVECFDTASLFPPGKETLP